MKFSYNVAKLILIMFFQTKTRDTYQAQIELNFFNLKPDPNPVRPIRFYDSRLIALLFFECSSLSVLPISSFLDSFKFFIQSSDLGCL